MTVTLPPFPVDDSALDMLSTALNPGPDAERTSLFDLLDLYSELAGSDTTAVDEDDNLNHDGNEFHPAVRVMRDPSYSPHDVIAALIAEVRRLRTPAAVS